MGDALSPRKRELVLGFDRVVSGMSVREFCHVHSVSTSTFYRLRERAAIEGTAGALRPRSRAPKRPATLYGEATDALIRAVREQLQVEGMEAGPWSIWWRMLQNGMAPVPSRSTIARRLRMMGLAGPAPQKRPRSSWRRFSRSAANELWQLDGMEFHLPGRERVTIYHAVDDCTRFVTGLWARPGGESIRATRQFLDTAFSRWGIPAAVLTDNGPAFNTHRRGMVGETEVWLASQGVRPISGRVGHPQTQGKVERAHQSVHAWLDARTITTLDELNHVLDEFSDHYSHRRQHQGLGLRITRRRHGQPVRRVDRGTRPVDHLPCRRHRPRRRALARTQTHEAIHDQSPQAAPPHRAAAPEPIPRSVPEVTTRALSQKS